MGWRDRVWEVIPFVAMMIVECTDVGQTTLSKAAMSGGMSPLVYVVYSNALGTLLLFPSFLLQRKKHPPLTFPLYCRFFLLGLIGYWGSLAYVIFRMEKLNLRRSSSQAKSLGTIVAISGACIATLYKGPPITLISSSHTFHQFLLLSQSNWAIGGSLLVITCFSGATWNIVQASTMKEYPAKTTLVFFTFLFGTSMATIFSLIVEKDHNTWKLKSKMDWFTIVYSAIFGTVSRNMVHTSVIHKKGPVYVSMFKPLGIVVAVAIGVTFLHDTLYIGSVIGAIVIVLGFYVVMWEKSKEQKMFKDNDIRVESTTQRVPLLENMTDI